MKPGSFSLITSFVDVTKYWQHTARGLEGQAGARWRADGAWPLPDMPVGFISWPVSGGKLCWLIAFPGQV